MQIIDADGWEGNLAELERTIVTPLEEAKRVLWLVCGGSNIKSSVEVMKAIPEDLTSHLTVMLTDERFGPEGHPDSNWRQLAEAGFEPRLATTIPTLQGEQSLIETVDRFNIQLAKALEKNDVVVAQYGIGPDGHIAGILPESPAALVSERLVEGYDGGNFIRITMTFPAIKQVDTAFAFAFGDAKKTAMEQLASQNLPLAEQPAQILKEIPTAYLYTDQLKEELS